MLNVLVLEDQPGWEALFANAVRNTRLPECRICRASTYGEAVRLIREQRFRVALLDYVIERAVPRAKDRTGTSPRSCGPAPDGNHSAHYARGPRPGTVALR